MPQGSIVGIMHDIAEKPHSAQSATFMPRCLLSFAASDERQMRPPHELAKVGSRPIRRCWPSASGQAALIAGFKLNKEWYYED
jgi:hypothetical protein